MPEGEFFKFDSDTPMTLEDEMRSIDIDVEEWRKRDYIESANIFAADVISKLKQSDALGERSGWAIFLENYHESSGSAAVLDGQRKVLCAVEPEEIELLDGTQVARPTIRVLTNEVIKSDGGMYLLSEDFWMDHNRNTYYFVDAAPYSIEKQGWLVYSSWTRLFKVEDGNFIIKGKPWPDTDLILPGFERIEGEYEDKKYSVAPFGTHVCQTDREYALEKARDIFGSVRNLAPFQKLGDAESSD